MRIKELSPRSFIIIISLSTSFILFIISLFNFLVDPLAYYREKDINPHKKTVNHFYQLGQIILNHTDAITILLGSSRAQTTPPLWIEKKLGTKTLNLGMGGADFFSKTTSLNMALQHTHIRNVIWFADYFELIPSMTDKNIKATPTLQYYLKMMFSDNALLPNENPWKSIFDHNMFEASFYSLKTTLLNQDNQGSGSYLDFEKCSDENFPGEHSTERLILELNSTYEHYTKKILNSSQSEYELSLFTEVLKKIEQRKVNFRIVIIPYHPEFSLKLKQNYPALYQAHIKWRDNIQQMTSHYIQVFDFFNGIPNSDGSVRFWNDGVHFNCHGAIRILDPVIQSLKIN